MQRIRNVWWEAPASCRLQRPRPIVVMESEMEETMTARSVTWDSGKLFLERISGT